MKVSLNRFGYHEVVDKPSDEAITEYYANKYYQSSDGCYLAQYDEEEREFIINKLRQKLALVTPFLAKTTKQSLLDVGCGEAFTLPFFAEQGWDVLGVDFSEHAIKHHHPNYLKCFIA